MGRNQKEMKSHDTNCSALWVRERDTIIFTNDGRNDIFGYVRSSVLTNPTHDFTRRMDSLHICITHP